MALKATKAVATSAIRSPKTTTMALAAAVAVVWPEVATAAENVLAMIDGNADTLADWSEINIRAVIGAIAVLLFGAAARDGNVSSEASGVVEFEG